MQKSTARKYSRGEIDRYVRGYFGESQARYEARAFMGALCVATLLSMSACKRNESKGAIKVAAAADLAFAFRDVGAAFEKQSGHKVEFSFGSTGQLAKQIKEGAPFDVFAAANVSFVNQVAEAGACDAETKAFYARGRIVIWSNKEGPQAKTLDDLLADGFAKIAIANPEHAPYGLAAKQAFESRQLWDRIKPKIVYAENVQQTLQFAQTGNAEAAITALSLATVTKTGHHTLIDESLHRPIDQALVACGRNGPSEMAKKFIAFVNSDGGRAIMKKFGFLLPGETLVQSN